MLCDRPDFTLEARSHIADPARPDFASPHPWSHKIVSQAYLHHDLDFDNKSD